VRLGCFIESIEAGKSFKCDEREPTLDEIGVAKVSAVTWGEYNETESKTCLDPEKMNPHLFIQAGDFLFSRANTIELVGACVIAKEVTKRVMLSDKTLRIKFQHINPYYFLFYLRSQSGRNEIMQRSTGNQESMRNIGQDRIRDIMVPIGSPQEIEMIQQQIQERFSIIDKFQETIDCQLQKSEVLRQSILKKAFSGKLEAQNPDDEPASVLLECIQAEKAADSSSKKQTNTKRKEVA
jgi:type I restriction enzyme S subunit